MNVRLAPDPAPNEDWIGQQDQHQQPYGTFHHGRPSFYSLQQPEPLRPSSVVRDRVRDHPRITLGNGLLYDENLAEPPPRIGFNCGQSRAQCQRPIDVEDLALYFEPDRLKSSFSSSHQKDTCYRTTCPVTDCGSNGGYCGQELGCDGCPSGTVALCTEEQWLQCPVSDRCPLYQQPSQGRGSLPPCLYDRYRGEYLVNSWPFGYPQDDQLLEDYLSNEKRKERSRDAARCRRSRETDIFTELAAVLPVPPDQAAHLDKASVMRLAIAYLKVRAVVDSVPAPLAKTEGEGDDRVDRLFPKALNGFIMVLSGDGNMVYLSENVSDYLGVSQMDMMGQSVYEYSHPCDHDEIRECLTGKSHEEAEKRPCSFFLRLKCTLTSKGRKVNLKSASYKVIHCVGRLTRIRDANSNTMEVEDEEVEKGEAPGELDTGLSLVLVGCPIPHPSNIEIPLGRHTFLSKHSLSMKFTYADEKLAEYLGWSNEELMGQSAFEFYHALDNLALDKSFKSLFSKGQCETVAYRFLGKRGGYAWVVTQATLIHCSKQLKPLSVVCVNYILSGVECEDEVYSVRQLAALDNVASDPVKSEDASTEACKVGGLEPTTELRLQVRINNTASNSSSSSSGTELEEPRLVSVASFEPAKQNQQEPSSTTESGPKEATTRPKPLAVTASTFRPAVQEARRQAKAQDGSRKDNTFPRPVHVAEKTFNGVPASGKQQPHQLEGAQKENEVPENGRQDRRQPSARPPFIFQGKPALELDQVRRDRPQAVTRQLFTPLAAVQQQQQQQQEQITCRPPPQTATASIFAPRTEDMNKGFLTFSEDQPGLTMLKDEPEDLTHLAPTPGDVCVPLEDTLFISDMLDEFILGTDNYCPLLSPGGALAPELRSADFSDPLGPDTARKNFGDSLADSDPFMYGDSPASPCSIDPGSTVSSSLPKYRQSPERSMDSLSSPTGDSGGDGLSEDEMLMLGISDSIADDELELRAPYIPMSDQDEALELLISDDMVMWGPSQNDKSSPKWFTDEREQRTTDSSLPQLLRTEQQQQLSIASKRFNDHGGGLVNPAQVLGQIPRKGTTIGDHWSTTKPERPQKRVHTACLETENEKKRIKCDDRSTEDNARSLENGLLFAKYRAGRRSPSLGGSQLLRRLVSQQSGARACSNYTSDLDEVSGGGEGGLQVRGLHGRIDETERDAGGGGGGGKTEDPNGPRRSPPCGSVLMNLLVSGCDDSLMDSRNVPTLKTSPLTVSLDGNQTVPQCPSNQTGPMSFEQLTTDKMITFDGFEYADPVATAGPGLLQVNTDLFGSLLDRSLV